MVSPWASKKSGPALWTVVKTMAARAAAARHVPSHSHGACVRTVVGKFSLHLHVTHVSAARAVEHLLSSRRVFHGRWA